MPSDLDAELQLLWRRVYARAEQIAEQTVLRLFGANLRGGKLDGSAIGGTGTMTPSVIAPSATSGQVLTTSGGSVVWAGTGSSLEVTDGTHDLTGVTKITVSGGVVGGTTPNATVTFSPGMSNPMTSVGDLILGGTSGTPARLPVGLPSYTLRAGADPFWADDGNEPIGLALTKYGVVIAPTATWEGTWVESPAVWFDPQQQRYGMVYTGYDGTHEQIGLAWSNDLRTWSKYASNPILSPTGTSGDPDQGGVTGPVLWYEGGTYYLFYIGCTGTGIEGGTCSICLATASSPTGPWTRHGQLIGPSGSGWRSTEVYHASLVKVGATYYLFFNAKGTSEQIGYATATSLTGPWTVDDTHSPVLTNGASGAWDSTICGDPAVWFANGFWYMAYFGYNGTSAQDGIAWTTAAQFPLGWTKHENNPILTPGVSGSYDSLYAHKPFIVRIPGCLYHYYTADNGTVRQIALAYERLDPGAVFTDPTTTKGDLIVHSSLGTVRLPVGSDGQVLSANSAVSAGVAWTTPVGAGQVLMQDGVTYPPVPLTTEDGTDWLYEG